MITPTPLVSVVMPTYNQAEFISETLESVLNQTFKDYELIIVNDGSTDNTLQILQKYQEHTQINIINQENRGCSAALNAGIKNARGKYISLISSDDLWCNDKLEKQVELHSKYDHIMMSYTDFDIINENSDVIQKHYKSADTEKPLPLRIRYINAFSVMIKRECFQSVGLFDENLKHSNDNDMWFRIGQRYNMSRIPLPLVKYRIWPNRLSSNWHDAAKYPAWLMVKHNLPLELRFPMFIWGYGQREGYKIYISEAKTKIKELNMNYYEYRIKTFFLRDGWYYYILYVIELLIAGKDIIIDYFEYITKRGKYSVK